MRSAVLTALIIATALFMENMDGTVISTSLPAIALDLHQDPIVLKLALTSYMLTLASASVISSPFVRWTLSVLVCSTALGQSPQNRRPRPRPTRTDFRTWKVRGW